MAAYDDLNVKRIFTVGILSVVVTAVTALAVQVLYYTMKQWQDVETAEISDYRRQNQILDEQFAGISTYGVDEQTGNIIIPIDKAIELVASEQAEKADTKTATDAGEKSSDET